MSTRRCLLLCCLAVLLGLSACGGSSSKLNLSSKGSGAPPATITVDDLTRELAVQDNVGGAAIPMFPHDDAGIGRGVSSTSSGKDLVVYGRDYFEARNGHTDGGKLMLDSPDVGDGLANCDWALYQVPGMYTSRPDKVEFNCRACFQGQCYFAAVSDYTTNSWKWCGPATNTQGGFTCDLSSCDDRLTSKSGCLYFLLCTPRSHHACHDWTTVKPKCYNSHQDCNCDCKPGCPLNTVASDGTFDGGVDVTWDAADGADSYEIVRDEVTSTPQTSHGGQDCEPDLTVLFNCDSVTVTSTKDLANVVLQFTDGHKQTFDNLSQKSGTFAGTGDNLGKEILKAWFKSGCNSCSDGPNYGAPFSPNYTYSNQSVIGTSTGTHYFDSTAVGDVVYRYQIRAVNAKGKSGLCSSDCGWTKPCDLTPDKCPTEFTATDGADGQGIFLTWVGGGGQYDKFNIYRASCGDATNYTLIGDTVDTSFHDTTAECNISYIYYVDKVCGTQTCSSNTDTGYWFCDGYCPTELTATDCEEDGVHLAWTPGNGYGVFSVFRQDGDAIALVGITEDATFLDDTAVCGISYIYWVEKVVCDNPCDTNKDAGSRFCGDFCPSGLVATDDGPDGVQLTWTTGDGTGTFEVLRTVKGANNFVSVATLSGPVLDSYFDDSAECDVNYTYKIKKTGSCGDPCYTNTEDGLRKCCDYCPSDMTASDDLQGWVQLSWNGGCEGDCFWIFRKDVTHLGDFVQLGDTCETNWKDTTADCDVVYIYKVKKRNLTTGQFCWSNEDQGYRDCCDYCPSNPVASDDQPDGVHITWTAGCDLPPGTDWQYKIQRRKASETTWTDLGMTQDTSFFDSTAECGVDYIYRVKRWSNGHDCFSNEEPGKRVCCDFCPSNLAATDGTVACAVNLTWDGGCPGGTFDIYRKLKGGTSGFKKIGWTTSTTFLDETGACGYHYIYKIHKYDDGGQACDSNEDEGWQKNQ